MKTDLVVAGYIIEDEKVLLIHHKKLGKWLPVGGHIEKDETPDEAIKREVMEEVSLEIEILCPSPLPSVGNVIENLALPFHVNVHPVIGHNHCCFYYLCRPLSGKEVKINEESNGFHWFTRKELQDERVPEDVRLQSLYALKLFEKNG